jgi:hypothetical protein
MQRTTRTRQRMRAKVVYECRVRTRENGWFTLVITSVNIVVRPHDRSSRLEITLPNLFHSSKIKFRGVAENAYKPRVEACVVGTRVGLILWPEKQKEGEQGQTRCLDRQQMECSQPRQFGPVRSSCTVTLLLASLAEQLLHDQGERGSVFSERVLHHSMPA